MKKNTIGCLDMIIVLAVCLLIWCLLASMGIVKNSFSIPLPSLPIGSAFAASLPTVAGHTIVGAPSISANKIDSVLCSVHSPACGTGQTLYDDGVQNDIDPAYALAFFLHESSYGTAGVARYTHSLGNMRCMTGYACSGGYASFTSWEQGYHAFYSLLESATYIGGGRVTIEQIVPVWAPPSDHNDDTAYINALIIAKNSYM
jgi:hypothetical protein